MLITIKSALVSGALMAVLGVAVYIIDKGDVFALNSHAIINVGVMAFLTSVVSLVKAGLTSPQGTVAGVQVK